MEVSKAVIAVSIILLAAMFGFTKPYYMAVTENIYIEFPSDAEDSPVSLPQPWEDVFSFGGSPGGGGETQPEEEATTPVEEEPAASNSIQLGVSGTQIVDGNGNPFQIKALTVSTNDRHKKDGSGASASMPEEAWFQESDVAYMKSVGLNTVDLHMIHLSQVSKDDGSINTAYYRDWLDHWVKWATDRDMYTIINFQRLNSPSFSTYLMPAWMWSDYGKPTNQQQVADIILDFYDLSVKHMDDERENFYKIMEFTANRYKDNPYVMIAPRNEPMHIIHKMAPSDAKRIRCGEGYRDIITTSIDRMSSVGYTGLVFVDRVYVTNLIDWSLGNHKIDRPNAVYEVHNYVGKDDGVNDWKARVTEFADLFIGKYGQPMYVGEWGVHPPSEKLTYPVDPTFRQMADWLNSKGYSWCYHSQGILYGHANWKYSGTDNSFTDAEVKVIEQAFQR